MYTNCAPGALRVAVCSSKKVGFNGGSGCFGRAYFLNFFCEKLKLKLNLTHVGDSGGPFYTIKDKKHYLVGITSYGTFFCDEGLRLDKLEIFVYFRPFLFNDFSMNNTSIFMQ